MARNIINEKGFKIIGLTPDECKNIGFGFQDETDFELICDNCNNFLNDNNEVYYIPVLNRVFCKECLINWYLSATYYPEDAKYESMKYDTISNYITSKTQDINITDL